MATSFTLDSEMQKKAGAKADADGLSLSAAVRLLLAGYVSGRITIAAVPATEAVVVERIEELPMDASAQKLANRIFAAANKRHRE